MKTKNNIINANQAVAEIAYKTNAICPIYPITPASEMSELVEEWGAKGQQNIFGNVPSVFEMHSEAGVAGAMHGALQTGSLSTTFTASQGLLLMLPNMYKIAGELTPNVIHVATRSIATHALSVFGDHSDIMAVRQSGYAFLGSASVQEAHDFALISQSATLLSRIPFVHFFDGFRTSHEFNSINAIPDETIKSMTDFDSINEHRNRALNPNNPVIRGTSQSADIFFQSREAINTYYNACPEIVQKQMNLFSELTGRSYRLFDYVGHFEAEQLIISMASSTDTIEKTVKYLNTKGQRVGLIKVRLFRPFSREHLLEALPKSVKSIAVLDRTKEPGSVGEPLYLDILQSISEAFQNQLIKSFPRIIGGRYGLSSKEFTPTMVNSIFDNLKRKNPKNNFTVGIKDDITGLSLINTQEIQLENDMYQAVFYQKKCKEVEHSFINTLNGIGSNSDTFVQGYIECDYKKLNSRNIAHLRVHSQPILAPYLISKADLVICQNIENINNDNALEILKPKGTILIDTPLSSNDFWQLLSFKSQSQIIDNELIVKLLNYNFLDDNYKFNNQEISNLHASFIALNEDLYGTDEILAINNFITEIDTEICVRKNDLGKINNDAFSDTILGKLLTNNGNDLPVSMMPIDGTFESNTSIYNSISNTELLPVWDNDLCIQCGACSMACPQGSMRTKVYNLSNQKKAPNNFKYLLSEEFDLMDYTVQNNPSQCTGCNNCVDICPTKALTMVDTEEIVEVEKKNWDYFKTIPEFDRSKIDITKVSQQQLQEPLFKYSMGVEGCGEAPYLKLVSQLFGDRLLVANATGASSIFGGALPTTPWSKNIEGKGPAWSNSLFEDNAEFGLGYKLSLDQEQQQAKQLLEKLISELDFNLVYKILNADQFTEIEIQEQRMRVKKLKKQLLMIDSFVAKQLLNIVDSLVKKSVWIVGGDGWAYDIGYGGLDHVIASGKNVNILVLDNEVYDNTGGQTSKSTPYGAQSKFAFSGKAKQKKDLGMLAMNYEGVYVASVAIGADQEQTLKAFNEAENFDGPSIIIAYCHSNSHGIDMKTPSKYHKAAVDSGQWLLYRKDPRRAIKNLNELQLDSSKPSIKIEDYLKLEKRFEKVLKNVTLKNNNTIKLIQDYIDKRFYKYESMASSEPKVFHWND